MGNRVCSREKKIIYGDKPLLYFGGEIQGWRSSMEDRTLVSPTFLTFGPDKKEIGVFAIFDGHGSSEVSQYLSSEFCNQLQLQFDQKEVPQSIEEAIIQTFVNLDNLIAKKCEHSFTSGSTAVVLLVTTEGYYTANLGDSRIMLLQSSCYSDLTEDHKPNLPHEMKRIKKAGYTISEDNRVNGMLTVSRAFGDFDFKSPDLLPHECAVSVFPDVIYRPWADEDRYLVLISDGLLERFDSEALCISIGAKMRSITSLDIIVTEILDEATALLPNEKDGNDNSSILIIQCPTFAEKIEPTAAFLEIETKLNSTIPTTSTPPLPSSSDEEE